MPGDVQAVGQIDHGLAVGGFRAAREALAGSGGLFLNCAPQGANTLTLGVDQHGQRGCDDGPGHERNGVHDPYPPQL